MSDAEVERMVQEAEQMREADEKRKEAVQATNEAETLCYQVEKQMSDLAEKISTSDKDDLKAKIEAVRSAMAATPQDPEEIKAKTKELQDASWKVTQQAYQQGSAEDGKEESSAGKEKGEKFEEKEKK